MKVVNTQHFWTFDLGVQSDINVPIWILCIFSTNERQHDQNLNNDSFYRMPVTSTQCNIGTEKYTVVVFY